MTTNYRCFRVANDHHGPPPETFPQGRRCARCRKTKLSIYNKTEICGVCKLKVESTGRLPLTGGRSKGL